MDHGDYTLQKIELVLAQISRLLESEFPHSDSKDALKLLKILFEKDEARIATCLRAGDPKLKEHACAEANLT
jgi:hypothetical protein